LTIELYIQLKNKRKKWFNHIIQQVV